jgi:hypothetical protein
MMVGSGAWGGTSASGCAAARPGHNATKPIRTATNRRDGKTYRQPHPASRLVPTTRSGREVSDARPLDARPAAAAGYG